MKATDANLTHPRLLLHGVHGSGKTHCIGLFHEALKLVGTKGLYLFDCDIGYPTLKKERFDVEFDLYVKGQKTFSDLVLAITAFESDAQGYGGVAIDSLTSLEALVKLHTLRVNAKAKRQFKWKLSQNDWGILIEILQQMLPQFQNLSTKLMFILTAHLKSVENDDGIVMRELPGISGKRLPSDIGRWFNEVWFSHTYGAYANPEFRMQTMPDNIHTAKTQTAGMPYNPRTEKAVLLVMQQYYSDFPVEKFKQIVMDREEARKKLFGVSATDLFAGDRSDNVTSNVVALPSQSKKHRENENENENENEEEEIEENENEQNEKNKISEVLSQAAKTVFDQ